MYRKIKRIQRFFLLILLCLCLVAVLPAENVPSSQEQDTAENKDNSVDAIGDNIDENSVESLSKDDFVWKSRPERVVIDDTLSFIFHPDTSSAITTVRIYINGGKRAAPALHKGLAFLTNRLCNEVTDVSDVRKLMSLGSSSFTLIEGDYSVIAFNCLSEHLQETLRIFTHALQKPLFSSVRISNIKKYMEYKQKAVEDDPEQLLKRELYSFFFSGTGLAGSIFGDSASLKGIKKKNITAFYKKFVNRSNMIITVSSNLPQEEIAGAVKRYFSPFPQGEKRWQLPPVKAQIPLAEDRVVSVKKETTQTLVALGALLPGISPQHFICGFLLENILGEGIGSKLWPLRTEQNLAYSIKADVKHMIDHGVLQVYLKTDNSKKAKALSALKEVLAGLYRDGITPEEFQTAKIRARAFFLRANETKDGRTLSLGFFETMGEGMGFNFIESFFTHLNSLTRETFNSYVKEALNPEKQVEVMIGPSD